MAEFDYKQRPASPEFLENYDKIFKKKSFCDSHGTRLVNGRCMDCEWEQSSKQERE